MVAQFLVTTTGTLNPVVFNDIGGRSLGHPTVELDLYLEYSPEEIAESDDIQNAITAGHITVKDENDMPIVNNAVRVLQNRAVNTGIGLSGGGDLSADRTIALDINGLTGATLDPAVDYVPIYDNSAGAVRKALLSSLSAVSAEMACVQARRSTNQTLTGSFADVALDTTDVENNSAVVSRSVGNPERIVIGETGLYMLVFQASIDADSTVRTMEMQILKNGTTVIPGSEREISEDDEINEIGTVCFAELTAGDYVTFQAYATGGTIPLLAKSNYAVLRCRAVKGDQGPVGSGSNVIIKDENVNVAGTPHSEIDFQGDLVSVANGGSGRAIVTVSKPVFGRDYQRTESISRSTTTSTSYQTKATLTTPALTGTYRVSWEGVADCNATYRSVEARLYNATDGLAYSEQVMEPQDVVNRAFVGGSRLVTFSGVPKTFQVQYRATGGGSTAGIAEVAVELWRVS